MSEVSLLLSVVIVLGAVHAGLARVVEVPMRVVGLSGSAERYVSGGVPLPPGQVPKDAGLTLLTPDGKSLPSQHRPIAFWPDGSVKWMLVDCFVDSDVERLTVRIGRAVRQQAPPTKLRVAKNDDGYAIHTGVLDFVIDKHGGGFIRHARLKPGGQEQDAPQVDLLRDENPQRRWSLDYYIADQPWPSTQAVPPPGRIDHSRLVIDAVELEQAGPLHACVVLRGRYLHQQMGRRFVDRPLDGSRVDVRIHAFAGCSYLILEHTFVYEGDPQHDFLQSLGLNIPLNFAADKRRRVTTVAGQQRTEQWMYANPLFAVDPPDKSNPNHDFPYWRSGGVVQLSSDYYRTFKLTDPNGAALTMDQGRRAGGWIDISQPSPAWGCAVGMVDMAENFPTGLAASNEAATISAMLYPPQASPLDLRRYTQLLGTGEADGYPGQATGISKTHRLWVYFHQGDQAAARCAELAAALNGHAIMTAEPAWLAHSGVVGPIRELDAQRFSKSEALLTDMTDFMLAHQRRYKWYGLFDYGDFQQIYRYRDLPNTTDNMRWMNDWGRWAWVNDEALISYWLMMQFLRTGRADYWRAAEAMIRHVRDVDVKHTQSYPVGRAESAEYEYRDIRGFGHRHNVHHWGDAYIGPRVANPVAWRLYYYMTGDGRTRDVIDEVYQANVVENRVWSGSDSMATALYALYGKWEVTGQDEYRRMIEQFLDAYVSDALDRGQFATNSEWNFLAGRAGREFRGTGSDDFFWHSFGMANFLVEWQALTADERLAQAIVKHARAALSHDGWSSNYCHFQILSAAYRLTEDDIFRARIAELLARHHGADRPVPANRNHWFGPKARLVPKTASMLGFMASGLPYVFGALQDERQLDLPALP